MIRRKMGFIYTKTIKRKSVCVHKERKKIKERGFGFVREESRWKVKIKSRKLSSVKYIYKV